MLCLQGLLSGDVVDEYYDECGYSSKRGQWKIGYYTDDFGDPTDEAYVYYLGKGTYTTDSSVSASDFYYIITDDKEGVSFYLLSSFLGSNLAENSIKGTFEIGYRVGSQTTRTNGVFGTKKADFVSQNDAKEFRESLRDNSGVKVLITQDGTVFESKKFNFGTVCTSSYYSAWKKAFTYTVSYDANKGKGKINEQVVLMKDSVILADASTFSRSRYEFTGWNTKSDGKGLSYKEGQTITPTKDIKLYAQWRQIEFSIEYVSNGGLGRVPLQTKKEGETTTLSSGTGLKMNEWRFIGWNTLANGKGLSYQPGDAYSYDKDLRLFAQWEQTVFTVSYNVNGGIGDSFSSKKERGVSLTLSDAPNYSKPGCCFDGWNTKADGSGVYYASGTSYSEEKDIMLYAQWKVVDELVARFGMLNEGDVVEFGTFEDSEMHNAGPIEWFVIKREGDRILLLSKYVLVEKEYFSNFWDAHNVHLANWEQCTLRSWLNNSFYKDSFNENEKRIIRKSNIPNDNSRETSDYVFILSWNELKLISDGLRKEIFKEKYYGEKYRKSSSFWLRASFEPDPNDQRYKLLDGRSYSKEDALTTYWLYGDREFVRSSCQSKEGVRPALWISIQ